MSGTKKQRKKDRWSELCDRVRGDDGLPVRKCGHWTEKKLSFWNRYVDIATSAMVGHAKWPAGLVYVDLFAGPGICRIESTDKICRIEATDRRIPGSPLIAAWAPKAFRKIILCELNRERASACEARMSRVLNAEQFRVFQGDSNLLIDRVAQEIPAGALTLAFIDPTGLHANFSTIEALSECGRVDFLILVADGMDIVRNFESTYFAQEDSKLDRFLGRDSMWREKLSELGNHDGPALRRFFTNIYTSQLRKHLDYGFRERTIDTEYGPLYRLIYASKSERGFEFWDKIAKRDVTGQKELF